MSDKGRSRTADEEDGVSVVSQDGLPPRPWPEATEPPVEVLADWLLSMTREQFVFVLGRQQATWGEDSRCFVENHEGRLRQADDVLRGAADEWQRGYNTGFEDAKGRAMEVLRDHK